MKYIGILILGMLLNGCVSQTFQKASGIAPESEICVVKNTFTRNDFFNTYRDTLHNAGFHTKEISKPGECSVYTTYTVQYGNHWGLYLARANLNFYKDGELVGSASYKAPRADPSKHGRVQGKIQKLVNGVFGNE
ncbi:MAG: hypothetical protein K6L76_06285 [Agarilytica sp.]